MLKFFAVAERDVMTYFRSFSFYLVISFFFAVAGYFFWSGLSYFSLVSFQAATNPEAQVRGLNLTEGVMGPFIANISVLLLLLVPIFTMRTFAEERKQGTLELLFTYPISNFQILIGKLLAMKILLLVLILPTIAYFPLASVVGARFETTALVTGYIGLVLVGVSFASLGIFVSSLTDNQTVSAGIGFALLLFFWIVGWIADWTSPLVASVFRELSLIEHVRDLTRGVIDTKDIAYFALFIVFFLFATLCSMEVRTWKR